MMKGGQSVDIYEHYDKIYTYCYYKVHHKELAEDITQEVYYKYLNHDDYTSIGKPLAYLYTIAKHLCIDNYRKPPTYELDSEMLDMTVVGQENQLLTGMTLAAALETLSEDVRDILLLRYQSDLSIQDIASVMKLSRFSVRRRIKSGLTQLQHQLKEEDFYG